MKPILKLIISASTLFLFFISTSATATSMDSSVKSVLKMYRSKFHMVGLAVSVKLPGDDSVRDYVSGYTARDNKKPINKNTIFQIGTNTESFTAAIILELVAEEKLSLDDTLSKWFPKYSDWQAITVRQLLNHTSGIYDYLALPNLIPDLMNHSKHTTWTTKELVDIAYQQHPNMVFRTGKKWGYSATDYALAGLIIEAVTTHTVGDEIAQRLLISSKLNLTNIFYLPYPKDAMNRLAHGYAFDGKTDVTDINMSWAGPAGAILSNPHDLALWIDDLFNGKVLQPKELSDMTALVSRRDGQPLNNSYENGAGLGIAAGIGKSYFFRKKFGIIYEMGGATLGYRSYFMYLPCYNMTVTASTNNVSNNFNELQTILNDVAYAILGSNEWKQYKASIKTDQLNPICKGVYGLS